MPVAQPGYPPMPTGFGPVDLGDRIPERVVAFPSGTLPMHIPSRLKLACALLVTAGAASAQTFFPPVPTPPGNPTTASRALLGKALFWDEQLSADRTMACGTCHIFGHGGTDPRSTAATHPGLDGVFGTADDIHGSPGVVRQDALGNQVGDPVFGVRPQSTGRRAPSVINAAYESALFWDGRATDMFVDPVSGNVSLPFYAALESQIAGPPVSDVEMSHMGRAWPQIAADIAPLQPLALADQLPANLQALVQGTSYQQLFDAEFGPGGVTAERIIFALAAYERTLIAYQTPYDLWTAGLASQTPAEQSGFALFSMHCVTCHIDISGVPGQGPELNDFRNIGVRPAAEDLGREGFTGNFGDKRRFKTPGLRNVALRAPYMHNGGIGTLNEVMGFYNRGGDFAPIEVEVQIIAGMLTPQDRADLVTLMDSLTDPRVQLGQPPFDRPRLWSESPRFPQAFGVGTAGSGGVAPEAVAVTPAYIGNSKFAIGVNNALPGTLAFFLLDFAAAPFPIPFLGQNFYLAMTPASQFYFAGLTQGAAAGAGYTSIRLPIPSDPGLAGAPIFAQWMIADPNGPSGLSSSGAVTTTLF